MSSGNKQNGDMQDYFELLKNSEEASPKGDIDRFFEGSEKALPKKPSPPPMVKKDQPKPEKKIIAPVAPKASEAISLAEKKPVASPITEKSSVQVEKKQVSAPPIVKEVAPQAAKVEEKKILSQPVQEKKPVQAQKTQAPVAAPAVKKEIKPVEEKTEFKKPTVDASIIEMFEGKSTAKPSALPENAPFKAEVIKEEQEKPSEECKKKEKNPFKRFAVWFKSLPKKKKIAVSIVAGILALILIIVSAAGIFVMQKFSLMGDSFTDPSYTNDNVIYEDEEIGDIEIDIGSAGFKQSLIDWATTGNDKHMTSKNVINVLLIGADSRMGVNEGNTDVMMLVSVNKKTKTLKMVSFLRDSYLYIEGEKASYCTKLNAAFSMGGPEVLIKTIENNYKIEIDNYVMVNFESFKGIVDAMGGISVDVQEYEANYMIKRFELSDMPVGEGVTLNGDQALAFCRARNCDVDGDVSRTRRQRQVIDSMVNRVMTSSISEINKYIDVLLPYVDTGYSKSQIISLGLKAITGGWAKYDRTQLSMPGEDCRTSGDANMWIWVVDYQKAAQQLQMELYGKSNIEIAEDGISIIDVYNGANYSGPSASVENDDNDEPRVPGTTKKDTSKTTKPQVVVPDETENEQPQVTEPEETVEQTQQEEPGTTEEVNDSPEEDEEPVTEPDDSGDQEEIPEVEEALDE